MPGLAFFVSVTSLLSIPIQQFFLRQTANTTKEYEPGTGTVLASLLAATVFLLTAQHQTAHEVIG